LRPIRIDTNVPLYSLANGHSALTWAWVSDPASPAGDGNHPMAFEDIADGGSAGKIPMGIMIMDDLEDLFTAPRGMLVP